MQKYFYRYLLKKNPIIVTVSEFSKREIVDYFHYTPERVRVIYPIPGYAERVIGGEDIARVRAAYALPERYFLYAGVLEPRKNLVCLVRAFEQYCRTGNNALVLAGKTGWHSAELQETIARSALPRTHRRNGVRGGADLYPMIRKRPGVCVSFII